MRHDQVVLVFHKCFLMRGQQVIGETLSFLLLGLGILGLHVLLVVVVSGSVAEDV